MVSKYVYATLAVLAVGVIVLAVLVGQRALNWLQWQLARPLPVSNAQVSSDGTYRNVIFLHHSTGRNLVEQGDLRALFTQKGYQFWDHDYNSLGLTQPDGKRTRTSYDIPGLTPAPREEGNTDPIGLAVLFAQPVHDPPDNALSRLLQHEVLMIKSCYPNSAIGSDEALMELKAIYLGIRRVMDQHGDRVLVILTTPPLHPKATTPEEASRARALAEWLSGDDFLRGHPNVFVFDFYDLLADPSTDMLRGDYQLDAKSSDSHPNALANRTIGPLLVDFVDQAVSRYRADRQAG